MLHRILNQIVKQKVDRVRPVCVSLLTKDLVQQQALLGSIQVGKIEAVALMYGSDTQSVTGDIEAIKGRLKVDKQYDELSAYFATDYRRLYMVNRNYLKFLQAIVYLYRTGRSSISAGVPTASAEIYLGISATQKSFDEIIRLLALEVPQVSE